MVHLAFLEIHVEAVPVHQVPVVGQVRLVEKTLRVQVHVQALNLVVLELAEQRIAERFRHVAGSVLLRVFLRDAVRVPYHERRGEGLLVLVNREIDGIAREVVVLHVERRVALQRKPAVRAVKIARIASDHHVALRHLHVLVRLGKGGLLVVDNLVRLDGERVRTAVLALFVLVELGPLRHREDLVLAVVFQVVARKLVRACGVTRNHIAHRGGDALLFAVHAALRLNVARGVREQETAIAVHEFRILVPGGALGTELHAIVHKEHAALQQQGAPLAGDSKAVRVLHDKRGALRERFCREHECEHEQDGEKMLPRPEHHSRLSARGREPLFGSSAGSFS